MAGTCLRLYVRDNANVELGARARYHHFFPLYLEQICLPPAVAATAGVVPHREDFVVDTSRFMNLNQRKTSFQSGGRRSFRTI